MVANEDGTGERQVSVRKYPNRFESVSWSPDGKTIATGAVKAEAGLSYASPVAVLVESGAEGSLTPKRWAWVWDLAWFSDGRGLAVMTQEQAGGRVQIGYISYPSGEFRRITSEKSYSSISLTADHSALATVQMQGSSDPWVAPIAEPDSAKPSTSGGQAWWSTWSPDRRIVFEKDTGIGTNIWMMDSDGRNARQLTADTASMNFSPRVSPDGRYIAFVSGRTGSFHIWRTDIDGSNPKQLTNSPLESWSSGPDFSADGKWVVYTKSGEEKGIWKVNIEGGDPVRLNDAEAAYPTVSPDGRWIAYSYRDTKLTPNNGVAIMVFDGGSPTKRFDIPPWEWFRWAADGSALLYVKNKDGVENIWNQPMVGLAPQQITHFNTDLIWGFDVSRDGKSLVIDRGRQTSDVVLIRDLR